MTVRTSMRCLRATPERTGVEPARGELRARRAFRPPVAARNPRAGREPPISQPMTATSTPSNMTRARSGSSLPTSCA